MIPYVFIQAYKNIYIRITIIFLIFILLLGVMLKNRIGILNYWSTFSEGNTYSNPNSWENTPYGFKENSGKSLQLYIEAIEELLEIAIDTYDHPEEEFIVKPIKLYKTYNHHLTSSGISHLNDLVNDLALFCPNGFIKQTSIRARWNQENRLKRRKLKYSKNSNQNPFNYAVTEDNYRKLKLKLEKIDHKYLTRALEQKPDSYSVISLQSILSKARCAADNISVTLVRALDYLEYKTEKKVYYKYHPPNGVKDGVKINPDRILDDTFKELEKR